MLKSKRKLGKTDIQYKIILAGKELNIGAGKAVTVSFRGQNYSAKMHNSTKGRIDGLAKLFNDFPDVFIMDKCIDLEYDESSNVVYLKDTDRSTEVAEYKNVGFEGILRSECEEDNIYDYPDGDNVAYLKEGKVIHAFLYWLHNHMEGLFAIRYSDGEPVGKVYNFATENSPQPIYFWCKDEPIVYYYTEADRIIFNPDSSEMFYGLDKLVEIDTHYLDWDFSQVKNASQMFFYCKALQKLDITTKQWNMENMWGMFNYCYSLETIADEIEIDLRSTKNAANLFDHCHNLSGSIILKNLNVSLFDCDREEYDSEKDSKLLDYSYRMFAECNRLFIRIENVSIGSADRFKSILDRWLGTNSYVKNLEFDNDGDNTSILIDMVPHLWNG